MRRSRPRNAVPRRRGVALMEAIIGGVILAIGLAVLVSIAANALSRQRLGEERIVAATLIDQLLNAVLTEGPLDFQKRQDIFPLQGTFEPPFEDFSYVIQIVDQGLIEPYQVFATVLWESGGQPRSERVDTLISQPGGDLGAYELRVPGEPISR